MIDRSSAEGKEIARQIERLGVLEASLAKDRQEGRHIEGILGPFLADFVERVKPGFDALAKTEACYGLPRKCLEVAEPAPFGGEFEAQPSSRLDFWATGDAGVALVEIARAVEAVELEIQETRGLLARQRGSTLFQLRHAYGRARRRGRDLLADLAAIVAAEEPSRHGDTFFHTLDLGLSSWTDETAQRMLRRDPLRAALERALGMVDRALALPYVDHDRKAVERENPLLDLNTFDYRFARRFTFGGEQSFTPILFPWQPIPHYPIGGSPQAAAALRVAVTRLGIMTALNPWNGAAWRDLGAAFIESGNYRSAAPCLIEARRLSGDSLAVVTNLGIAWDGLRVEEKAEECFRTAARVDPECAELWFNAGVYKFRRGPEEANDCFEVTLEMRPDFPEAWNNYGATLYKRGKSLKGLAAFRRALELWPQNASIRYNVGLALLAEEQLEPVGRIVAELRQFGSPLAATLEEARERKAARA